MMFDALDKRYINGLLREGEAQLKEARKIRANGYAPHMTPEMRQHHRNCMTLLAKNLIKWGGRVPKFNQFKDGGNNG